jgi:hypothetical protein
LHFACFLHFFSNHFSHCCNHLLPLQHSFWSFFQCVVKTMNVTYWLAKLFRTKQFPFVSMANLKHLVLQEGTCGYGAFLFNIPFCLHFGWGCTLVVCFGGKHVKKQKETFVLIILFVFFSFRTITSSTLRELYESCKGGGEDNNFWNLWWLLTSDNVFSLWPWNFVVHCVSLFHLFCTLLQVLLKGVFVQQQGWGKSF